MTGTTAPDIGTSLPEAMLNLDKVVDWVCDNTEGWEALTPLLLQIQEAKTSLKAAEGLLIDEMVRRTNKKWIEGKVVDGLGKVTMRQGRSGEQWEGERLGREVAVRTAAQLADDPAMLYSPDDGERLPPAVTIENVAIRVAEAIVDAAGLDAASKTWRSGSLKARGIEPKNFRKSKPGNWSVVIQAGVVDTTKKT